jgi:hypothetical protein
MSDWPAWSLREVMVRDVVTSIVVPWASVRLGAEFTLAPACGDCAACPHAISRIAASPTIIMRAIMTSSCWNGALAPVMLIAHGSGGPRRRLPPR